MSSKEDIKNSIQGLVDYIYINKELDSLKGACLDYVLIMLNKLKKEVEDVDI